LGTLGTPDYLREQALAADDQALTVAGHLAERLPVMGVGGAGSLWAPLVDPACLDFLMLIDRAPAPSLGWRREVAGRGHLVLDWTPLGVEVAAVNPTALFDGLEFIAERVDRLLPAVQAATGGDHLRDAVALALRRDLGAVWRRRPPGVRLTATVLAGERPLPPPPPVRPVAVEDHRAVIPPRGRRPTAPEA
jgi:hypothetical protein